MTKFPNSGPIKKIKEKKRKDQLPSFLAYVQSENMEIINDQIPKFQHYEKKIEEKTKWPTSYLPYYDWFNNMESK